jgi:hypothetical protein
VALREVSQLTDRETACLNLWKALTRNWLLERPEDEQVNQYNYAESQYEERQLLDS